MTTGSISVNRFGGQLGLGGEKIKAGGLLADLTEPLVHLRRKDASSDTANSAPGPATIASSSLTLAG